MGVNHGTLNGWHTGLACTACVIYLSVPLFRQSGCIITLGTLVMLDHKLYVEVLYAKVTCTANEGPVSMSGSHLCITRNETVVSKQS